MRNEAVSKILGRRLRQRRRLLDLTQRQVAARCGMTFQLIHKYEAGIVDMSVARLLILAEALRMPLSEMLDGLQALLAAEELHEAPAVALSPSYLMTAGSQDRHAVSA